MALTPKQIDEFLARPHTLVIATLRRDGTPHLTTVWYRWDGEAFWIATDRRRAKFRNIRRDHRVGLLVDDPARETSVSATGRAEVAAEGPAAFDGALAIVARYVDDPAGYLAEREEATRVLLRVRPDKLSSWTPD
jgi:PPOX class probable F420-dependent enzyme